MQNKINEILEELSYRSLTGIIDLKDIQQRYILKDILLEKLDKEIAEQVYNNLYEAKMTKGDFFKNSKSHQSYFEQFIEKLKNNENIKFEKSGIEYDIKSKDISFDIDGKEYSVQEFIQNQDEIINADKIKIITTNKTFNLTDLEKSSQFNTGRKNSTASSNVNEFMTLFFLKNNINVNNLDDFIQKNIDNYTGILKDGNDVSYEELKNMLDADTLKSRNIEAGKNNAIVIKNKIAGQKISEYHWTDRKKPGGINKKNPSDIILKLNNSYIGFSLKFESSDNSDNTPKINTGITNLWEKDDNIINLLKNSFIKAAKSLNIPVNNTDMQIGEKGMEDYFGNLVKKYGENKINDTLYHEYQKILINNHNNYIKTNFQKFLKLIKDRTFIISGTPCPYDIVIASPSGSVIKSIDSNEDLKFVLDDKNINATSEITITTAGVQTTNIFFISNKKYECNIRYVLRTRVGGFKGIELYFALLNFDVSPIQYNRNY